MLFLDCVDPQPPFKVILVEVLWFIKYNDSYIKYNGKIKIVFLKIKLMP